MLPLAVRRNDNNQFLRSSKIGNGYTLLETRLGFSWHRSGLRFPAKGGCVRQMVRKLS